VHYFLQGILCNFHRLDVSTAINFGVPIVKMAGHVMQETCLTEKHTKRAVTLPIGKAVTPVSQNR
jgi:hypothetical protein